MGQFLETIKNIRNNLVYQNTLSTTGWNTTTYNTVVPSNILLNGKIYTITISFDKPGTEFLIGTYITAITGTSSGSSQNINMLAGNVCTYGGTTNSILLRYKNSSSVFGIEGTLSNIVLAGGNLTVTVTLY